MPGFRLPGAVWKKIESVRYQTDRPKGEAVSGGDGRQGEYD